MAHTAAYIFGVDSQTSAHMDFIIIECTVSCFDHSHTNAHTQIYNIHRYTCTQPVIPKIHSV